MNNNLSCFKKYDIRGIVGRLYRQQTFKLVAKSFASHLDAKLVVVGRDARKALLCYAMQLKILCQMGVEVLDIGLSGTEEMYCATSEFNACGGIQVTASHNRIEYNGLKMVKKNSVPLDPEKI